MEYIRKQFYTLKKRLLEPRKFMQVLAGPRQVGKSTLVNQVLAQMTIPHTIEVKSGRRGMNSGLPEFVTAFHPKRSFVVGTGGVSLEDFLNSDVDGII